MPTSSWTRADWTRRLGATALVSAASTAALLGVNGTASAAFPTEQTIDDAPQRVEENAEVTFQGKLTATNDRPLAGEVVELQRDAGAGWASVTEGRTDSNGEVAIPVEITEPAKWRLMFNGDQVRDGDGSDVEHVDVKQKVNEQIVQAAAAQEGDPYSYGATGPDSFDCSGLTQYVHDQVGIELPRTSSDQRAALPEISSTDKLPGDLIFFHDSDGSVYHVGIYAGENQIWHAPQDGETVHKKDLWTDDYTVGRAW